MTFLRETKSNVANYRKFRYIIIYISIVISAFWKENEAHRIAGIIETRLDPCVHFPLCRYSCVSGTSSLESMSIARK